ncbi:TMEM43 family protein [Candidatus Parcubacteria bacterium]|nr:TMEM43 family protein [Candidatus Parcubacteria bacterium]
MPDQFTTSSTVGFGRRIINSLMGLVIGPVIFVISFGVLYWNEGRYDLSQLAKKATEISSSDVTNDQNLQGKLVSTTGTVKTVESLGDIYLKASNYLALNRKVEMYSWVEKKDTSSHKNFGGSETTDTTYTYTKGWTENPSSNFAHPEGHQNPTKNLSSLTKKATTANVGVYRFDPQAITLPSFSQVVLSSQNVNVEQGARIINDQYVFTSRSNGTFDNPGLGDLRVSYGVVNSGIQGTTFGALSGNRISSYNDGKGNKLFRLFEGSRGDGISTIHGEYRVITWVFRIIGFLMMWIGLMAFFGPIGTFLDFIPMFGGLSRGVIGFASFLVSFVLTVVTVIISMIIHNLIALIIALVITAGVIVYFIKRKKRATA